MFVLVLLSSLLFVMGGFGGGGGQSALRSCVSSKRPRVSNMRTF